MSKGVKSHSTEKENLMLFKTLRDQFHSYSVCERSYFLARDKKDSTGKVNNFSEFLGFFFLSFLNKSKKRNTLVHIF